MSYPQPTPGPWKWDWRKDYPVGSPVLDKVDPEDFGIALWVPSPPFALGATGAVICTADRSPAQAEADARLIASAPELLKALEGIERITVGGYRTPDNMAVDLVYANDAARAAIRLVRKVRKSSR